LRKWSHLLDVQDALPAARRLHDWAMATAAVRPGDQVLDLGSHMRGFASSCAYETFYCRIRLYDVKELIARPMNAPRDRIFH
jgi:hypothetical protein